MKFKAALKYTIKIVYEPQGNSVCKISEYGAMKTAVSEIKSNKVLYFFEYSNPLCRINVMNIDPISKAINKELFMKIDTLKVQTNGADSIFMPHISTNSELVLVDAGYPGMLEHIERGLLEKGLCLTDVTQLWLTHHDHDHVGSLAEIKRQYPKIIVKASAPEIAYIEGNKMSLRLKQAVDQQASLPKEAQEDGLGFQAYLKAILPCNVDKMLIPGDSLLNEQMQILDTPGHTEGHVSFYAPASQTLIAGDLVVLDEGILKLPFPQYAFDLEQAKKSLEAVAELPIQHVICYHGGVTSGSTDEMSAMLRKAAHTFVQ